MTDDEIRAFLKREINPINDTITGNRFRASAYLRDGTYLPCVVFQSKDKRVELALRRFAELDMKEDLSYRVVESFVAGGAQVPLHMIKKVEPSPFAWPWETVMQIRGETVMSWTAFVVEMDDSTFYSYGTSYSREFFDLPKGYSFNNIRKIHNDVVYTKSGIQKFAFNLVEEGSLYRDKPYFTCFTDGLVV